MHIIHTADWHLGKIVNGIHMTEDQSYVLDQLIHILKEERPDLLIIAGDIYDRAVPPREAVQLLNRILSTIHEDLQIPILIISGNHDSVDRLDFASNLLRKQNVFIQTKYTEAEEPIVLYDDFGPVYFHLVPYIEPEEVREIFQDDKIKTHEDALRTIVESIEKNNNMNERHIFVGHTFLQGGKESDSEEKLSMVGGVPYVPASLFTNFTYVALGHLHQAQKVYKDYIRYSGSILKYSFSEVHHKKTVTSIQLNERGIESIKQLPLKPKRDLRVIKGYFKDLIEKPIEPLEDYLHVILLDEGKIIDPIGKLRKIYPNILRLERKTMQLQQHFSQKRQIQERKEQSKETLFQNFYKDMTGENPNDLQLKLFNEIVTEIQKEKRGE